MARVAPTLLLASLLLAGCSGSHPADAEGNGSADVTSPSDLADTAASPATGEPNLELQDCWSIRTSLPVAYASAKALLPADLKAASWVEPGDETLAMADLIYFDCAKGSLSSQATGPSALLFVEIPLEVPGALSGENVFPVLVVHTNPAIASYWDGKWKTQEGTLIRTSGPPGTSTTLAIAAGPLIGVLEVKVPDAVGAVLTGSFQQLFGGPDERRTVTALLTDQQVGLGGSAEFIGTGLPLTSADAVPLTLGAGIAVANGPLAGITFSASAATT